MKDNIELGEKVWTKDKGSRVDWKRRFDRR